MAAPLSSPTPHMLFHHLPPIFILTTHLDQEECHEAEDEVLELGGRLTSDANEARIFLARVSQKKRAAFDLRAHGVWTEEATLPDTEPPQKRRKVTRMAGSSGSDTDDSDASISWKTAPDSSPIANHVKDSGQVEWPDFEDYLLVLKIDWLEKCIQKNTVLPFNLYTTYCARIIPHQPDDDESRPLPNSIRYIKAIRESSTSTKLSPSDRTDTPAAILARARAESQAQPHHEKGHPRPFQQRRRFNTAKSSPPLTRSPKPPQLHRTTTSEFENLDSRSLPPPPAWVRDNNPYSCLRSTPLVPANTSFLAQLHKIKQSRILTLDEIGVRAYSTSIASIAAYPYPLQSDSEVLRLPGCDQKIASLFAEWLDSSPTESDRHIKAVQALDADQDLQALSLFYNIWGVGAETARKFYFDRGWKDLDDVVEFGWTQLTRVQQIGVKYYDDFALPIPRDEVEAIAAVIHDAARTCRGIHPPDHDTPNDIVSVIVGGHRRGKPFSGDVDVILSHRNPLYTKDLVLDVVATLEAEGYITHTLSLHTTNSNRNQATLPYRGEGYGHGFDSLDKALSVWQDPHFDSTTAGEKNPNLHRRVDIIISPWRTVGCAILGWSGGNTFQRDIRRYVKRTRGWKFDSSGIRDRATGLVLELEGPKEGDEADEWLDRERRLMEGLGIGWREAGERCTG